MLYGSILECIGQTPLVALRRLFAQPGVEVIAKLELLNPGGSVKDRPARFILESGWRDGTITPATHLIESSSGNLGIALAMTAGLYGLPFTCVVDPKIAPANLRMLRQFGAHVEMVDTPDDTGGYLKTRLSRVQEVLRRIPGGLWVNQYANRLNWQAHYEGTGDEIVAALDGPIDYFVAAVSTTGTLMGVARRLREVFPALKVVAVDACGSVIFGGPPGARSIPGIGSSIVPDVLDPALVDAVVYVDDQAAVAGAHRLLRHEGIFAGGSSGAVIAGIERLLGQIGRPCRIVTLLPDRGERYLETVYDPAWRPEQMTAELTLTDMTREVTV